MERTLFFVLMLIMMIIEGYLVYLTNHNKKVGYRWLRKVIIAAICVTSSYTVSALANNYHVVSTAYSLYFVANSFTCFYTLNYMLEFARVKKRNITTPLLFACHLLLVVDVVMELINPFKEIVLTYENHGTRIAPWVIVAKPFYHFHLTYCYAMMAMVLFVLIARTIQKPKAYRAKFTTIIVGIIAVIVVNALYLYIPKESNIDFSVFLYCAVASIVCWNSNNYESSKLITNVRALILDELGHPVVLFDEANYLATCNHPGEFLIGTSKENEEFRLNEFLIANNFDGKLEFATEDTHFQWSTDILGHPTTYRVDYRVLKDEKQRIIGRLFVFTDNTLEMDVLTGFHSKNSFERYFTNLLWSDDRTLYSIAICDLNRLSLINKKLGEEVGDRVIVRLAELMKEYCPRNSYFARMEEANLLVAAPNMEQHEMRRLMNVIRAKLVNEDFLGIPLDMQSAISVTTDENPSVLDAAEIATFSMRSKKLMDGNSAHSSLLDSLAQTLMESDSTTESHVLRTKEMGEMLGVRLGLTDVQLSNLALLCLLHDIGKLGVPLEILNKPGKLSDAEWDIMKSHTEKGYRIAKASKELEGIADFILHHHEAWNGRGYPDGLKAESIPLLSRIIAVVDSYDAMTNDRPYHKAISEWEAREELRRCAGVQFDPIVVSEYLALLDQIRPVKKPEDEVSVKPAHTAPRGVSLALGDKKSTSGPIMPVKITRYYLDKEERVIAANENFEELTGYTKDDIRTYQLHQFDLIPPEDREHYFELVGQELKRDGAANLEHRLVRKDGSIRTVLCYGKQCFVASVPDAVVEIQVMDIAATNSMTEALEKERQSAMRNAQRWEENSRRDSLTGILNHEAFINETEMQLLSGNKTVLLMILDVDYFKNYNDTYGHMAGDKMLSLVAKLLSESVGEGGFAGRLGGDEFAGAIIVPEYECATPEKLTDFCERETARVWQTITNVISAVPESANISLGATVSENAGRTFSAMYRKADKNLYVAKEHGRNGYQYE